MADEARNEPTPESDIYTILLIVATIFLAVGTVFGALRAQTFFGAWIPF